MLFDIEESCIYFTVWDNVRWLTLKSLFDNPVVETRFLSDADDNNERISKKTPKNSQKQGTGDDHNCSRLTQHVVESSQRSRRTRCCSFVTFKRRLLNMNKSLMNMWLWCVCGLIALGDGVRRGGAQSMQRRCRRAATWQWLKDKVTRQNVRDMNPAPARWQISSDQSIFAALCS